MSRYCPAKHIREFECTIRPHGLTIVRGRGHPQIVDATGPRLTPVSSSPSDTHACNSATVRRLIRLGALPAELRKG